MNGTDHPAAAGEGRVPASAVIAGGGVIGLATACELLRRGVDVVVADPEPASGATRAAAGMLAPVAEVVWDQPGLYPLMVESAARYPAFAARIAEASGMDAGFLECGTLVLAGDSADRAALTELAQLQRSIGMDAEVIGVREARTLEPALGPGVVGAVRIPGDHQVDPRRLAAAMLAVLGERVVRARVAAVRDDGGRAGGVVLDDGRVLGAEETVVAAGIGVGGIAGLPEGLRLPVRPVHGDVVRLRVPERLRPLTTRVIRGVVQGRPVYVVPRADGTVVLGATSREDDLAGVSADGVHQLLRDASRLVPAILECEITELIARARPGSPDDVPMIGRVAPGLTVSAGYFRHGILLTAVGADLTADAVCGLDPDPRFAAAVDPRRFSRKDTA
ncbi:glycine oxidase ThiO [Corynebacterium sp. 335C]